MVLPWFKLYGLEYLADAKIQRLTAPERSCWITLLCVASMDEGTAKNCSEEYLMGRSGIDPLSEEWNRTRGVLVKFELLGFIHVNEKDIIITNWQKRQEIYSESRDRVRRWRAKNNTLFPVTPVTLPETARREKKREEKKKERTSKALKVLEPVNDFLGLFKEVNPSYETLYSNRTQRCAAQRLLKKFGIEAMQKTLSVVERTNGMQYAPVITTPLELEKLGGKLKAFLAKQKDKSITSEIVSV
jgi:hypothetical protein